jgi:hypothetical protein
MTGNVEIIRHSYKVERAKKVYTVYQLVKPQQKIELTDLIRIEKFRKYSNGSGFDHYLRLRNTTNWKTSEQVTGLFKTECPNIFYGDRIHSGKKNLLVFQFSKEPERLIIDYYKAYYPKLGDLRGVLQNYNTYPLK